MVKYSFLLLIAALNVFFQHAFELFDELTVDFEVYESVAELSLTVSNLEEELSLGKLLLLNL